MIKAIFFDFDGVLTKEFNGHGNICENLCRAIPRLSTDEVMKCHKKHFNHLHTEDGTHSDTLDDFCECVGQNIAYDVLKKALRTVTRNEAMFELAQSLQKKYTVGIIIDNSSERIGLIDEDMKLSEIFDPIVISATANASKHEGTTKIFDTALEAAQCEPEESVFIDNQERNLVTPKQMRIKTYWHDDKKNDVPALIAALRDWGVEVT